jgi:RNA recognition motif-containing protein
VRPPRDARPVSPTTRTFEARGREDPIHIGKPRHSQQPANNNKPASDETTTKAVAESRRIFVENLTYMAKEEDISRLFLLERYNVERVVISIDPFTGRNPSYCFVELQDKDHADQAMQKLNGQEFFRCPLKVKPCIPKIIVPAAVRPFDRWEHNDAD